MVNFTDEIKQKLKIREKELQILAAQQFQKDFLTMTGYKIGDIVPCYFATYHGTSKQAWHSGVDAEGEIVQDESGDIYVKSIKQYHRAYTMDNGRTGRSRRDWWAYELEYKRSELMQILKTEIS